MDTTRGCGGGRRRGRGRGRLGRLPGTLAGSLAVALALSCGGEPPPPEASGEPVEPDEPVRTDDVLEGVFSPDGRRLALTWDQGAGPRVVGLLAGTDSTPPEPGRGLPLSPGRGAWASWAPDGLWIAYEAGGDLRRMRPDGTGDEPLTSGPVAESHPAYAPAGDGLAFVAAAAGEEPSLWLAGPDGSEARPLPVPVSGRWGAPAWHPSGSWLAAEVLVDGQPAVYRVDPESGSAERLAAGSSPAFGPSGETVWYARGDSIFRRVLGAAEAGGGAPGQEEAAPGGTGPEELVITPGRAPQPAPDGARLAFVRGNHPAGALYLLALETGEVLRVTGEAPSRP